MKLLFLMFLGAQANALNAISSPIDLAQSALEERDYSLCMREAKRAEEQDPSMAEAPFVTGLCAERAGDFELAYKEFLKSKDLNSSDPDVFNNLTIISIKSVRPVRAEHHLREFRTAFPNDPRIEQLSTMLKGLKELIAKGEISIEEMRKTIRKTYLDSKKGKDHGNQT